VQRMDTLNKAKSNDLGAKYLTFSLGGEEYGIEIMKVKEILGVPDITPVPQTPGHIKGVINLRGKVVPVMDLRIKFGLPPQEYHDRTCLIVVETTPKEGYTEMTGLIVDAVSEVIRIESDQIAPPPHLGAKLDTDYILGMARREGSVRILLDIDRVAGIEDT
jgi:purine-binding chemotaxis protein CheW